MKRAFSNCVYSPAIIRDSREKPAAAAATTSKQPWESINDVPRLAIRLVGAEARPSHTSRGQTRRPADGVLKPLTHTCNKISSNFFKLVNRRSCAILLRGLTNRLFCSICIVQVNEIMMSFCRGFCCLGFSDGVLLISCYLNSLAHEQVMLNV